MAKLRLITQEQLPAPEPGWDLAIWSHPDLPSETQLRTWAGWSETHLLAHDQTRHALWSFDPQSTPWKGSDIAVGSGRVWRFDGRFMGWLTEDDARIPEIGRALSLAGVGLVVGQSSAWPSPYLDPFWRIAQANQIFALVTGPHPRFYRPCDTDPDQDGQALLASVPGGLEVAFSWDELLEARRLAPIHRGLRPTLYKANRWWHS
jgi:hypothetical protein